MTARSDKLFFHRPFPGPPPLQQQQRLWKLKSHAVERQVKSFRLTARTCMCRICARTRKLCELPNNPQTLDATVDKRATEGVVERTIDKSTTDTTSVAFCIGRVASKGCGPSYCPYATSLASWWSMSCLVLWRTHSRTDSPYVPRACTPGRISALCLIALETHLSASPKIQYLQ